MATENRIEKFSQHWHKQYMYEPYYDSRYSWDDFDPAYRYAWEQRRANAGSRFEDVEDDLEAGWEKVKGKSRLAWDQAKAAVRSGWNSIENVIPGDSDRDGR